MRQDEESEFREGIVVDRPTRPGQGSFVNCGMKKVGIGGWVETRFPDTPWLRRAHGWRTLAPGISACQSPIDADLGQRST